MRIGIVIVSYEVRHDLIRCLEHLGDHQPVVVVDNASTDDSVAAVRDRFASVKIVENQRNVGFATAVNQGFAALDGVDAVLLLNPDTALHPNALPGMMRALEEQPSVAAFGFRQVDGHGRFQLSFGPPPWLWADAVRKVVQNRLDQGADWLGTLLDTLFRRPCDVPWVTGSSLLVRADAFRAVDGFDEDFFLYFEDVDFCLRLRKTGFRVRYDPRVTLMHRRGQSAAKTSGKAANWYRQSQVRFWKKHRGPAVAGVVRGYLALKAMCTPARG